MSEGEHRGVTLLQEAGVGRLDPAQPAPVAEQPAVVLSPGFEAAHARQTWKHLKRVTFLVGAAAVNAAVAFVALILARRLVDDLPVNRPYLWLCVASGCTVFLLSLASRPDRQRSAGGFLEEWIEAAKEALLVGLILVLIAFFWRPFPIRRFSFSRGTVLLTVPLLFVFLGSVRSLERLLLLKLRKRGHNLASVVVIGDGASASAFLRTIHDESGTGYRLVAHLPNPGPNDDLKRPMQHLASTLTIDEVVIATNELSAHQIQEVVAEPSMRGVRIRAVPELFGLPPSKVEMISFADFPLLTLFENPVRGARWRLKRAVDLVVASVLLILLSPALAVMALAIRWTSEGPILFRQVRVGMDGKLIEILKFRSMLHGAPDSSHQEFMKSMLDGSGENRTSETGFFKLTDDPRVTRVGRFLRRFSLDELPQLLNVLKGEMSLVGPRPAIPYEVQYYEDWQRRRFDVLPGITGLWQVSGRSRLSPSDMLRLDVHYAETWSLPKDFVIILRTIPAVLRDDAR